MVNYYEEGNKDLTMGPTNSCNDVHGQAGAPLLKKDLKMKSASSCNDLHDQPGSPTLRRDLKMKPSNSCNDLHDQNGSPSVTPRAPVVVVSNSSKALASSTSGKSLLGSNSSKSLGGSSSSKALLGASNSSKSLVVSSSSKSLLGSNSSKSLVVSNSSKALGMSNSGKRMDQKKKYVKQVTGKNNDTELHLAAQRGEASAVKEILGDIDAQMLQTLSGAEFDAEVAEIRSAVVHEVNELGETPLFTAAERGHINVVKELLPNMTKEGLAMKNNTGFDALHIAARQGHQGNTEFDEKCFLVLLIRVCFKTCVGKRVLKVFFARICCITLLFSTTSNLMILY